jgi:predicted  nucleic acid-binding Zn-ribbon protein
MVSANRTSGQIDRLGWSKLEVIRWRARKPSHLDVSQDLEAAPVPQPELLAAEERLREREAEIDALTARVNELDGELAYRTRERDLARKKLRASWNERDQAKEARDAAQGDVEATRTDLAMLRAELKAAYRQLDDPGMPDGPHVNAVADELSAELAERGTQVAALQGEVDDLRTQLEASTRELERSRTLVAHREGQVEKLRAQIDALKERIATDRANFAGVRADHSERLRELREERRTLRLELAKVPRYEFGSYTPGVPEWRRKWERSPGRRVLLYALKDYSGSFMKWATAINEHTDWAARLVAFGSHPFGYAVDLVLPMPDSDEPEMLSLVEDADVIHIKDETGFWQGTNRLPRDLFTRFGKPLVFTHYGGYARKFSDDPGYQDYVASFAARIAMTPDLVYEWFDGYFVPHSVDVNAFRYEWSDSQRLAHSPSTAARKGTEELTEAIEGLGIEFDLIQGVEHQVCLERKRHAGLFFDQAGREVEEKLGVSHVIGWYGNSALEAAVHGIPTIAHLSEQAFEGAERAGKSIRERCAILNTPLDAAGMREVIAGYFALPADERQALSQATRRWVEDFHSFEANGRELVAIYEGLRGQGAPRTRPPSAVLAPSE